MSIVGEVSLQHLLLPSLTKKLTVTTHSHNHFSPLYILSRTLLALQLTDGVQESIVEVQEAIAHPLVDLYCILFQNTKNAFCIFSLKSRCAFFVFYCLTTLSPYFVVKDISLNKK